MGICRAFYLVLATSLIDSANVRFYCITFPRVIHGCILVCSRYAYLFEAIVKCTKINVPIIRFMRCLIMGFNMTILKNEPWYACMTLNEEALRPLLIISTMLLCAKTLFLTTFRRSNV